MNSIDEILGMIATEGIEHGGMSEEQLRAEGYPIPKSLSYEEDLPPMRYNLGLVRKEDGTLYWYD